MAPHFAGFKPLGLSHKNKEEVLIHFEEYEALNLCDYELLTQAEAAKLMNVSRPTFTRIYESARRKIAKAFIEGCAIRFDGGSVDMVRWLTCSSCGISFTDTDDGSSHCPFCKAKIIS
jgi:predicted DNA-binding protein (UPF0251 family)